MPILTDVIQDILLQDAAMLTGAASLLYTGTVTGVALAALFSRRPERRRAARQILGLLVRRDGGDEKR